MWERYDHDMTTCREGAFRKLCCFRTCLSRPYHLLAVALRGPSFRFKANAQAILAVWAMPKLELSSREILFLLPLFFFFFFFAFIIFVSLCGFISYRTSAVRALTLSKLLYQLSTMVPVNPFSAQEVRFIEGPLLLLNANLIGACYLDCLVRAGSGSIRSQNGLALPTEL